MRFKARTDQTVKQGKEAKMQKTVINAAGRNSLVHVVAKADLGVPKELYKAQDKKNNLVNSCVTFKQRENCISVRNVTV